MDLDILFLACNRLEYTQFSWQMLVENTNWSLVERLVVVDDGSKDGTKEFLHEEVEKLDFDVQIHDTRLGSPVSAMCYYLSKYRADCFAKIDNDIVVPPGWLEQMHATMERCVALDLLGMAAGWTAGQNCPDCGWIDADHIGGVGLMRQDAFRRRLPPVPNGRFGFTEWQHRYRPMRGWACPDVEAVELDRTPFEPWLSLSERYQEEGWQRRWPTYDEVSAERYCSWWPQEARR